MNYNICIIKGDLSMFLKKLFLLSIFSIVSISTLSFQNTVLAKDVDNIQPKKIATKVKWYGYDEGIVEAKKQNKKIIIDFYTEWCSYCKKMDKSYNESSVFDGVDKNFVNIKINCESDKIITYDGIQLTETQLAKKMGITGYPTTMFFDNENKYIDTLVGYFNSKELKLITTYVADDKYKTKSLNDFFGW